MPRGLPRLAETSQMPHRLVLPITRKRLEDCLTIAVVSSRLAPGSFPGAPEYSQAVPCVGNILDENGTLARVHVKLPTWSHSRASNPDYQQRSLHGMERPGTVLHTRPFTRHLQLEGHALVLT
jgi:hypothetical protein